MAPKQRSWAMASLMKHDDWLGKQKFTWPLVRFGTNKDEVREGKVTTLKTEEDVRQHYAQNWGILSPEYPHSGSGWFRARYAYAAQVGSVLYGGPRDGAALGSAYQNTVASTEKLSDTELNDLAILQQRALSPYMWTKDKLKFELEHLIVRAQLLCARS
jgi:hypothetical protein